MKARAWREALESQRLAHGKVLFTVTELASLARIDRSVLHVELSRLRKQGILVRYAHGLHGLPGAVSAAELLPAIDSHAYMTGLHALHVHGLTPQAATAITCFTDRRSPRARVRATPVGRFVFVCVRSKAYSPPAGEVIASPEQALCDFIYLCLREGTAPTSQVTFRGLQRLRTAHLLAVARRYPTTVRREAERLLATAG